MQHLFGLRIRIQFCCTALYNGANINLIIGLPLVAYFFISDSSR